MPTQPLGQGGYEAWRQPADLGVWEPRAWGEGPCLHGLSSWHPHNEARSQRPRGSPRPPHGLSPRHPRAPPPSPGPGLPASPGQELAGSQVWPFSLLKPPTWLSPVRRRGGFLMLVPAPRGLHRLGKGGPGPGSPGSRGTFSGNGFSRSPRPTSRLRRRLQPVISPDNDNDNDADSTPPSGRWHPRGGASRHRTTGREDTGPRSQTPEDRGPS